MSFSHTKKIHDNPIIISYNSRKSFIVFDTVPSIERWATFRFNRVFHDTHAFFFYLLWSSILHTNLGHDCDERGHSAAHFVGRDFTQVHRSRRVRDAVSQPLDEPRGVDHWNVGREHHQDPANDVGNGGEKERLLCAYSVCEVRCGNGTDS